MSSLDDPQHTFECHLAQRTRELSEELRALIFANQTRSSQLETRLVLVNDKSVEVKMDSFDVLLKELSATAREVGEKAILAKWNVSLCTQLRQRVQTYEGLVLKKREFFTSASLPVLAELHQSFQSALELVGLSCTISEFNAVSLVGGFDRCQQTIRDCFHDLEKTLNESEMLADNIDRGFNTLLQASEAPPGRTALSILPTFASSPVPSNSMPFRINEEAVVTERDSRGRPLHKLGRGSFGIVYLGLYQGQPVAVKDLDIEAGSAIVKASVQREVELIAPLHHTHVVRLYGYVVEDDSVQLIMEYLPGGSLSKRIHGDKQMSTIDMNCAIDQVVAGMVYLHSLKPNPIIHRDLKSANIMFDHKGHVRVIDFGLARAKEGSKYGGTCMSGSPTGTLRYLAPELFNLGEQHTRATDVFAFGVIVFEMATRQVPYEGILDVQLKEAAQSGCMATECKRIDETDLNTLCLMCVAVDRTKRLSFAQIFAFREVAKVMKKPLEAVLPGSAALNRQEVQHRTAVSVAERESNADGNLSINASASSEILTPALLPDYLQPNSIKQASRPPESHHMSNQRTVIDHLVQQLSSGSDHTKAQVAGSLTNLAYNNAENQMSIAATGSIKPLIELLSSGSEKAKENAAGALWSLAGNAENQVSIAAAGAIKPLIELLSSGSDGSKVNAAGALWDLADNVENKVSIAAAGAIKPLIELLSSGSDGAQGNAAGALGSLAGNAENQVSIAAAGAINPLIELLPSGSEKAKENAAGALAFLAWNNDQIRSQVVSEGGIRPLAILFKTSAGKTKKIAATALDRIRLNSIFSDQVNTAVGGKRVLDAAVKF